MGGPGQDCIEGARAPSGPQGYASESTSSSGCYWNIGFGPVQETKARTGLFPQAVRSVQISYQLHNVVAWICSGVHVRVPIK